MNVLLSLKDVEGNPSIFLAPVGTTLTDLEDTGLYVYTYRLFKDGPELFTERGYIEIACPIMGTYFIADGISYETDKLVRLVHIQKVKGD